MVDARMGLLDEAIREHLELKRLRGSDPGEMAREEHEALGSPYEEVQSSERSDPSLPDRASVAAPMSAASSDAGVGARESAVPTPDLPRVGEETVELDMSAVLNGENPTQAAPPMRSAGPDPSGGRGDVGERGPTAPPGSPSGGAGESLEWEMPGDREAGQASAESETAPEEPGEDVLEAIPDFLRETPDQERLWFEQQPPRDFDFDK
jgi:hypothetical protein